MLHIHRWRYIHSFRPMHGPAWRMCRCGRVEQRAWRGWKPAPQLEDRRCRG